MTLPQLLGRMAVVVGAFLVVGAVGIVGRDRLRRLRAEGRDRVVRALPYLLLLGVILGINSLTRKVSPDVSWLIGTNLTGTIYAIEGEFVAWLQTFATPELTAFFSFVYIYGYVFVLVFPVVAYLALEDQRYVRQVCLAYSLNYAIGLLLYVVFIAYGPRNLLPDVVQSLMYQHWPEAKLLTSTVNTNTNVFPSLHSSLSVTVALLAVRTRRHYPAWATLATALAVCIVVATMYLGIHWATDVVAGAGLAALAVWAAPILDAILRSRDWREGRTGRLLEAVDGSVVRLQRLVRRS